MSDVAFMQCPVVLFTIERIRCYAIIRVMISSVHTGDVDARHCFIENRLLKRSFSSKNNGTVQFSQQSWTRSILKFFKVLQINVI